MQKYSLCSLKKSHAYDELQYKLDKFVEFNPLFGRRIIKQIRKDGKGKTIRTDISFNDKHINFYKIGRCNFNRGHLGMYDPQEEEEENNAETEIMEEEGEGEDEGEDEGEEDGEGDEHDEYREDYEEDEDEEPDEAGDDDDEEDESRESSEEGEVEELPGRTTRNHRIRRRDETRSSSYNVDSQSYNLMREFEREISDVPAVAIDSLYIIYNGSSNVQSEREENFNQSEIETGSSPSPTIDANRNINDFYDRYLNHP
jgi:hypothetical protein